jgi:hypothetical protein
VVLAVSRAEVLAAVRALADEHMRTVNPAPYTTERALIERLDAILTDAPLAAQEDDRGEAVVLDLDRLREVAEFWNDGQPYLIGHAYHQAFRPEVGVALLDRLEAAEAALAAQAGESGERAGSAAWAAKESWHEPAPDEAALLDRARQRRPMRCEVYVPHYPHDGCPGMARTE